jgi:hypothetical protein
MMSIYTLIIPITKSSLNKTAFGNVASSKSTLDVNTFYARLGHTSVSKLVHLSKTFDVSNFKCESCLLSKHHRLPFPISNSMKNTLFGLIHVDLWGPYKQPALNGAYYFFYHCG